MSAQIDVVLGEAIDTGKIPGVVAMATTADGAIYEGAFGVRRLGDNPAMTLDTVFRIASMTKAITCVAAMQLVEQGKLSLDGPVPAIDPGLAAPQVLDGFDAGGQPILRPAKRPITLKHLMTHTAGFCYEQWNADLTRYVAASGMLQMATGKLAAMRMPLMFDPGERWEYGINIDWIGRLVEEASGQKLDAYLAKHVTGPLGMKDTGFAVSAEQRARQASIHQHEESALTPQPFEEPIEREFLAGGGGLYSTAGDYLTFLQMLLKGGSLQGAQILKPETVALMGQNHIGGLQVGVLKSTRPPMTNDLDPLLPGQPVRWGLGYMLTPEPGPNGRSAGSVNWAGIFNTYYWLDPVKRVAGVIMTQILPFLDPATLAAYGGFERGVYAAIGEA